MGFRNVVLEALKEAVVHSQAALDAAGERDPDLDGTMDNAIRAIGDLQEALSELYEGTEPLFRRGREKARKEGETP
jgi:ABC-type transporter Mla subunit MlaD